MVALYLIFKSGIKTHFFILPCSVATFGYTGEYTGDSTQLVYLRARYYSPEVGHFLTKDSWNGDPTNPMSFNAWNYVDGNPVNFTDPTGQCPKGWHKNSNGTCSFEFFTFLPGGGVTFTVPDSLT